MFLLLPNTCKSNKNTKSKINVIKVQINLSNININIGTHKYRTFYCPIESYRKLSHVLKMKRFDSCSWASGISRFIQVSMWILRRNQFHIIYICDKCVQAECGITQDKEKGADYSLLMSWTYVQLWWLWNHCVRDKNCRPDIKWPICFGLMRPKR